MATNLPKVIYVAGYGRSGSTVLDMMLGANPQAIGVSEVTHLFQYWDENRECSCGEPIRNCEFWSQVTGLISEFDAALFHKVTRRIEKTPLWVSRRFRSNEFRKYGEIWRQTFQAIAKVAGRQVVVDSSKSARKTTYRSVALAELLHMDFGVVHLVRDPRAVAFSYLSGNNLELEQGRQRAKWGGAPRVLLSWLSTNALVHLSRKKSTRYRRVRYEDLVAGPDLVLDQIENELGLPAPADRANLVARNISDHGIAGNRVRRQSVAGWQLKPDDRWKQGISFPIRAWSMICWPLMKTYGYD